MAYKWDDSLATGYMTIDNQHIQLFAILDRLIDESKKGMGDEVIFNVIEYLTTYTMTHFKTEEELMIKYEYKEYPVHYKLHDEFRIKVKELKKRVIDEGPTEDIIKLVTDTIGKWLSNHIKYVDYLMADFIKTKDANKNS
uniref:Hemerythrin-like metal-binding protein n=1 Tax=uncultured bacterium contig00160 TaxID=1181593 RepID=A0A806KHB2_9BACT|nr:hemerythrin-like metal-binding protein [uncultured bacterium contig00160]